MSPLLDRCPRPTRRSEAGMTLVEVMLTILLGALVAGPILAWMVLGYRTHDTVTKRSHDDDAMVFLSTLLSRDVSTATVAMLGGPGCPPAPGGVEVQSEPPATTVVLTLVNGDFGSGSTRTGYSITEATRPDGEVVGTLVRRRCTNAPSTVTTDETVLMDRLVRPGTGWESVARCIERPGFGPSDPCGGVVLTLTGPSLVPASVTATLRTGPAR